MVQMLLMLPVLPRVRRRYRSRFPWVLLPLVSLGIAGNADAGSPEVGNFTGVQVLTRANWNQSAYGSKKAIQDAVVVGGATDAGTLSDFAAPMDHSLAFKIDGTGWGCRMTMLVYDGGWNGAWKSAPTAAWSFTVDHFPYQYDATASTLFGLAPSSGFGVVSRLIRLVPSAPAHQPAGLKCTGGSRDSFITFIATGQYQSVLMSVQSPPIMLYQSWPGPTTKGTTFQLSVKGAGPVVGPAVVTLSGPAFPNVAHSASATLPLVAPASSATSGVFFPATIQGTTLRAFPDLAKLAPGTYVFDLQVQGALGVLKLLRAVSTHVRVDVAAAPPASGATITAIVPGAAGYFTGDPEQLAVAGTPGDLGSCDSYGLQLSGITGGANQSLTFKKKTFPETLSSGADFTALGSGVWQALVTPSGILCKGTPRDGLVEVEAPTGSFVKDRPTLTMGKDAFLGQQATFDIAMPASYAALPGAANIACCDTELYFKNKAGVWASHGGTINRNFTDSDDPDAASDAGVITYAEFMQNPAAVEWALRVRATAPGQQFAWSNLARFTVQ